MVLLEVVATQVLMEAVEVTRPHQRTVVAVQFASSGLAPFVNSHQQEQVTNNVDQLLNRRGTSYPL